MLGNTRKAAGLSSDVTSGAVLEVGFKGAVRLRAFKAVFICADAADIKASKPFCTARNSALLLSLHVFSTFLEEMQSVLWKGFDRTGHFLNCDKNTNEL